jgi:hypothetical protein
MIESDRVPGRGVAIAIVAAIIGIALSVVAVWVLDAFDARGGGRSDVVYSNGFHAITPHEERRLGQIARLHAWSWADRDRGRVLVPIEVAIDRYVGGSR